MEKREKTVKIGSRGGAASSTTLRNFINLESQQSVSLIWFGSWCRIARHQAHRPLNHLQPHLLKIGAFPDGLDVAQAVVEHAAFAESPRPDDGEILVRPLHALAGEVE